MLWETREFRECRDGPVFGDSPTPAMRIRCVLAPQAKIFQKGVLNVLIFGVLWRLCILCKWGLHQVARFCQEPRRFTTDVYQCFLQTGNLGPKYRKSAVFWSIWSFASSRTAFSTLAQSKRWGTNREFPVDLFVWCCCISRNVFKFHLLGVCLWAISTCWGFLAPNG